MSWREAFDLAGERLRAIRAEHGQHALGVYYGNPAAHNSGRHFGPPGDIGRRLVRHRTALACWVPLVRVAQVSGLG